MIAPGGPPCCSEHRCRRKQPIEIQRGGFSGQWYALTRYKRTEHDDGRVTFEAQEKHVLHPMVSAALDVAKNHWSEVVELYEQRQAELARHQAERGQG